MKKFFTLMTALFALTATGWAQDEEELDETFVFTDLDGNVVPDGTVLTINTINEDGQLVVPLIAKNVSGAKAAVSMYESIDGKPNGDWQTCAFGNCMILSASGYSPKNIVDADYNQNIQTEWIPEEGQYGLWTATLQIHVFNITQKLSWGQVIEAAGDEIIGYGPKVTVNFAYQDPAGINAVERNSQQVTRVYNLNGAELSGLQRGLNIVRMSDGTTVKRMVK